MKLKVTALLFIAAGLFSACDDLSLINYDLNFATAELTIGTTDVADTTYTLTSEAIDPKSELESNGVDADLIKEATIKSVEVNLASPETGNFDWAKGAKVFISADGQPEVEMASIDNVPDGLTKFSIETLNLDLIPYIQAGSFTLRMEGTTDAIIAVEHKVIIKTTFNVAI